MKMKFISTLVLLIQSSPFSIGQLPTIEWPKEITGDYLISGNFQLNSGVGLYEKISIDHVIIRAFSTSAQGQQTTIYALDPAAAIIEFDWVLTNFRPNEAGADFSIEVGYTFGDALLPNPRVPIYSGTVFDFISGRTIIQNPSLNGHAFYLAVRDGYGSFEIRNKKYLASIPEPSSFAVTLSLFMGFIVFFLKRSGATRRCHNVFH